MPDTIPSRYARQFPPRFAEPHKDHDLLWVVPFRVAYIVGLVGHRFAGKSTALSFLAEKRGFQVYTLSSVLRELATARGIPLEPRRRLQELGDELRAENRDGGYLARLALRRIRKDHLSHRVPSLPARIAVSGFKHPEEVRVFQNLGRFHMVVLESHARVRFRRGTADGVIQEELRHIETALPAAAKPLRPTFESFSSYIDDRDRTGFDRARYEASGGSEDRHSWVRGGTRRTAVLYDQQVDAVIGLSQRSRIDRILDNGAAERSRVPKTKLFHTLSDLVDELDGQYRSVSF
jgi:hypothetical protein